MKSSSLILVAGSGLLAGLFAKGLSGIRPVASPPPEPVELTARFSTDFEQKILSAVTESGAPRKQDDSPLLKELLTSTNAIRESLTTIAGSIPPRATVLGDIDAVIGKLRDLPPDETPTPAPAAVVTNVEIDNRVNIAIAPLTRRLEQLDREMARQAVRDPELSHYYLLVEKKTCDVPSLDLAISVTGIGKDQVSGIRIARLGDAADAPALARWATLDYATRKEFTVGNRRFSIRFMSMIDRIWWLSNYTLAEVASLPPKPPENRAKSGAR